MKKLLIFNWKMAPQSLKEARRLLNSILNSQSYILNSEIVVAPPSIYLSDVRCQMSDVKLASQNVFWEDSVAYTGEISPKMLKNLGVEYVLIGHSERRKHLGETDEMINKKVLAGLKAGLKVILCVGEQTRSIKYKVESIKQAKNYVKKQLEKDLKGLSKVKGQMSNVIVAYEPLWSIGTGHSDNPRDALEMIKFIKKLLTTNYKLQTTHVIYGGSVDSKNITEFLKYPEIDGALVGGASLKAGEVKRIIEIASKIV